MTRPDNSQTGAAKEPPLSYELERTRGASENRVPQQRWQMRLNASMGRSLMTKWNEAVSDRADQDPMVRINREQDDEFCRKLRAALRARKETCPVGVSTEPGTKRPILKLSTA